MKKAIRVNKYTYNLFLEEDFNTKGHNQWFLFKTYSTLPAGSEVTFNILNLVRPAGLYSNGMIPFAFSVKKEEFLNSSKLSNYNNLQNKSLLDQKWERTTYGICYFPNSLKREINETNVSKITEENKARGGTNYFTLKFQYKYEYPNDEVFFSQFIPYSYTEILNYLNIIEKFSEGANFIKMHNLCYSLARNFCPLITISENISSYFDPNLIINYHQKSKMMKKAIALNSEKFRKQVNLKTKIKELKKISVKASANRKYKSETHNVYIDEEKEKDANQNVENHPVECIIILDAYLKYFDDHSKKKAIFLTGRVHSG